MFSDGTVPKKPNPDIPRYECPIEGCGAKVQNINEHLKNVHRMINPKGREVIEERLSIVHTAGYPYPQRRKPKGNHGVYFLPLQLYNIRHETTRVPLNSTCIFYTAIASST